MNLGIGVRRTKRRSTPEIRGFSIDSIDDQRTAADETGRRHAALQRMLDETGADTLADPVLVSRQLAEEQAGNGVGRLPRAD